MPPGLDVWQIGQGFVLGVWQDEFGVDYVRRPRSEPWEGHLAGNVLEGTLGACRNPPHCPATIKVSGLRQSR